MTKIFDLATRLETEVDPSSEDAANDAARAAEYAALAPERLKNDIVLATEAALNAFAQSRGYDSIMSASTYKDSTVPKFAVEGQYCAELRDQTWAALYAMLAEVEAGTRSTPENFEAIANELPTAAAIWPEIINP